MAITIDGADNKLEIGANATGPSSLRLYEDTDNGTNYVSIIAPSSLTTDRTLTLPDNTGTIVTTGSTGVVTSSMLASGTGGKVLQVVQTVKTSFFALSVEDVWTDVTGVSVSITPSSTSNKILLFVSGEYGGNSTDSFAYLRILRDSTSISIGDSRGSSIRATMSAALRNGGGNSPDISRSFGCHILDSPSTTSSITYTLQMLGTNVQPFCVGGSYSTSDGNRGSVPTFITAMEIAA